MPFVVGILRGEGSGPELIGAACRVLNAVAESSGLDFCIKSGGEIGCSSAECTGEYLSDDVAEFCRKIFAAGGGILAGAAGGAFVCDKCRPFDRSSQLNPLRSYPRLRDVRRIK